MVRAASAVSGSQPIQNLAAGPGATITSRVLSYAGGIGITTTRTILTENGVTFARYARPVDDTPEGYRIALISQTGATNFKAGQKFTILFRFRGSAAWAQALYIRPQSFTPNYASLGDLTVSSGTAWQWYRSTGTMLLDGVSGIGVYINLVNMPLDSTLDIAEVMLIPQANYSGQYYDGNSYGWRWEGTAGASISVGYPESPLLVRNIALGTLTYSNYESLTMGSTTGVSGPTYDSSGGIGIGEGAIKRTRDGTVGSYAGMKINAPFPTGIKIGDIFRWAIWIKHNSDTDVGFAPYWELRGGTYIGANGGATVTVPPNTWVRIVGERTVSTSFFTTASTHFTAGALTATGTGSANSSAWWTRGIATFNQPLPEAYCDGNTPGWRWEGTANASPSVGYPYTLESIAGAPLGVLVNDNAGAGKFLAAPAIGALAGRTIYAGYDSTATSVPAPIAPTIGGWGAGYANSTLGYMAMRADMSATTTRRKALNRTEYNAGGGAGGTFAVGGTPATVPLVVRSYAICGWITEGLGTIGAMDGLSSDLTVSTVAGSPVVVGNGLPDASSRFILNAVVSNAATVPQYIYFYLGEHNRATREAVQRWLGNKYGISLAA